jgi:SAM-dependent methyltransferase
VAASTASIKRAARGTLRHVMHTTYDTLDRLQHSADPLVPPRELNPNIGFTPRRSAYAAEFVASGDRIAEMLISYADLEPSQSVLDIGCGIGRVARALTKRLSTAGRYQGFDVDPKAVAWCAKAYRPYPNFSFAHASVGYVNVKGDAPTRGEDFVFPYPDSSVDVAFSVSVYTHLSHAVIDHYLAETSRVLRPGGVCANTFFVMDQFAIDAMRTGRADRAYRDLGSGTFLCDAGNPNLGIGFTPDVISALHRGNGLSLVPPVRSGTWSGRKVESFVYQDVVVARKSSLSG